MVSGGQWWSVVVRKGKGGNGGGHSTPGLRLSHSSNSASTTVQKHACEGKWELKINGCVVAMQ